MDNGQNAIKGIRAHWSPGELGDNLITFNKLISEGVYSEEEAALQTFTGKMAEEKGFNCVKVFGEKLDDGTYKWATVIFKQVMKVFLKQAVNKNVEEYMLPRENIELNSEWIYIKIDFNSDSFLLRKDKMLC